MAQSGKVLFKLPIAATKGGVVVTEPAEKIYLITFTSPPDNRLISDFCNAVTLAFDILENRYPHGVVITTSGIAKFYSNGLDLQNAISTPNFWGSTLYPLWRRVLTYPGPTIALINGHGFAGALILAMMHDYRVMNPHKGFLCLNEVELGAAMRPPMISIFRQKVSAQTLRKLVLEAGRFKALEALKEGLVDHLGSLPETLAFIDEFKLVNKAQKGMSGLAVYADLRQEMWGETIGLLEKYGAEIDKLNEKDGQKASDKAGRAKKVGGWEKAKL